MVKCGVRYFLFYFPRSRQTTNSDVDNLVGAYWLLGEHLAVVLFFIYFFFCCHLSALNVAVKVVCAKTTTKRLRARNVFIWCLIYLVLVCSRGDSGCGNFFVVGVSFFIHLLLH